MDRVAQPTTSTTNEKISSVSRVAVSVERVVDGLQHFSTPTTNHILDAGDQYSKVDLLKHLPDDALIKRLTLQTSAQCKLPPSTTFLVLLGAYSSISCRQWVVDYPSGHGLPIGLYVVAEQPSATGKTRCLNVAQAPFFKIKTEIIESHRNRLRELNEIEEKSEAQEAELVELLSSKAAINSPLFVTNSTPEGLEKTLLGSKGFFSAVSSEQGLFNSLLGLSYSTGENNNDMLLNAFDGGFVSSCRISREGYFGNVVGGVVLFAQPGSVEKILGASNGTGISERFAMVAEPHYLGIRDHLKVVVADHNLNEDYAKRCQFAWDILKSPKKLDELLHLKISTAGHRLIAEYRNQIEPHLADGMKYSHISLRGAAGKIDMQIMKIAATLHLLERDDEYQAVISDALVIAAIGIANELLEGNLALCRAKGIIGESGEFKAILKMFENDQKPKTERQIIQSRSTVEPFKSHTGNKSVLIRQALEVMCSSGVLASLVSPDGIRQYIIKQ